MRAREGWLATIPASWWPGFSPQGWFAVLPNGLRERPSICVDAAQRGERHRRCRRWCRDRAPSRNLATLIPRPGGGFVWEFQAWVDNNQFVRIWDSDQPGKQFLIFADGGDDDRSTRYIRPIGAVWLTDQPGEQDFLILAWHSVYDGGEYSMFRITSEGITELITGGGGGC